MDLETLLKSKEFLDDLSLSIRNIILASFPHLTQEEREDIDNEVKLKLWRKVARGKKVSNLRSYLWRVVYTTALDLIAGKKTYLPLENVLEKAEDEGRAPEQLIALDLASEARENRLRLERAVDALPERRKAVARLYLTGQNIGQIAGALDLRENQVRHLLYRGLADIRTTIGAEREAPEPERKQDESEPTIKKGEIA